MEREHGSVGLKRKESLVKNTAANSMAGIRSQVGEYFRLNQLMNVPERNRFVQAIQHDVGVAADMRTLSRFVREQVFYVFVHDFKDDKDDCLSAEGEVCQEFIESYFDPDHNENIESMFGECNQ